MYVLPVGTFACRTVLGAPYPMNSVVDGVPTPVYTLLVGTEVMPDTNGAPLVMNCLQVLTFPAASIAFHVRVVKLPAIESV